MYNNKILAPRSIGKLHLNPDFDFLKLNEASLTFSKLKKQSNGECRLFPSVSQSRKVLFVAHKSKTAVRFP